MRPPHIVRCVFVLAVIAIIIAFPGTAFCSVESSLTAIQTTVVGRILPLAGALGIVIAALSFMMGHPNARTHLTLAMIGAGVGFGATSIISFIQSVVH